MTLKKTVADLVLRYSPIKAEQTALIFLNKEGRETETYNYRRLRESCLHAAGHLRLRTAERRAVLLAVEKQSDFVIGFFGCLLAGLIPVPVAPLRSRNDGKELQRTLRILEQGDIRTILVDENQKSWLSSAFSNFNGEKSEIWTVESLAGELESPPDLPEIDPEDIAYIQYTSGSTSQPKGVVLKHKSVVSNLEMMFRVFNRGESVRVGGWIPFHHDMGLVGHLFTVLYESGFGVFMPPEAFLARPALWLETIDGYRVNSAAAPNFAFEHCVQKIDSNPAWDLSCWKNAYVGSEIVDPATLEKFSRKFAANGFEPNYFRPVYGLAEATLLVSGGSKGFDELKPFLYQKSVGKNGRGRVLMPYTIEDGCEIFIKEPATGALLGESREGEIWIRGQSLSDGYLNHSKRPPNGDGIPTGDIGFITDGRLFISGREKDVVIVRGVNYAADDLESAVRGDVETLRDGDRSACVAHFDENGEQLWILQEIHRHTTANDLERTFEAMRGNLLQAFGISPDRLIFVPSGLLPKTPNYKLSRKEAYRQYVSGELKSLETFPRTVSSVRAAKTNSDRTDFDPVVVVGTACRFPGGADDPEKFWELLVNGGDAITEVPTERWNNELFYDEKPAVPGKLNTKWAGFLDNISHFDPVLFGISPFEAPEIDPQQRLLLETSWRLIEQLGWKKERLAGSATGVFIGISTNDYLYIKIKTSRGMNGFNAYSGLGNANSIAANRLSYFYDLRGPSIAVDTACSSSLTAFHLGVRAVLGGECEQAFVGGVNVILSPGPTITLSQFGMMSPEGRCKTFDAGADGYVRAEGCGLVMLKRRSAAIADGDRILAVVEASTVAQDGASTGITFPNGSAQNELIRHALDEAGFDGGEIGYVEAHGTGTAAGDPVEIEQIGKRYGKVKETGEKCFVGSVKANIGHLEAAAGVASIIKAVLMLQNKIIPPQIHLTKLNPLISFAGTRLAVARETVEWQSEGRRRTAISSFGFGGSLAHVILAEPDGRTPVEDKQVKRGLSGAYVHPFVVSAHTPEAVQAQIKFLSEWLSGEPLVSLPDLSRTLALGRSDLGHRTFFLAASRFALQKEMQSHLRFKQRKDYPGEKSEICFLFTGQGEHYLHMGREMDARFPVFRAAFDRCAAAIDLPDAPFRLRELAFSIKDTRLWTDEYMQPILFAVQYALAMLYEECGITPDFMLGHSLGEYAAACLSGCFTPEDGMRMLYRRGRLVRSLENRGFMCAIFADPEEVAHEMDETQAQFAAINSPRKTVVSGDGREINRLHEVFRQRGIETYFLKTETAFHSHLLEPILEEFQRELAQFSFSPPNKKWISALRGTLMTGAPDAGYWTSHLRETVHFERAVAQLKNEANIHFVEIGPGATTLAAARENLETHDSLLLRSLNIKKGSRTESYFFLNAVGKLYEKGFAVNWKPLVEGKFVPHLLPGQRFMRKPYWIEGGTAESFAAFASPEIETTLKENGTEKNRHYAIEWTDAGILPNPKISVGGDFNWLVVGRSSALVDAVLNEIKRLGGQSFWLALPPGNRESRHRPSSRLSERPDKTECYNALSKILGLQSRAEAAKWKIIYVSDSSPVSNWSAAELDSFQEQRFGFLIPFLQAMYKQAFAHSFWIISENGRAISGDEADAVNIGAAPLWGFGKTLFLEHPEWRGGMIDLAERDDAAEKARTIIGKTLEPQFEPYVAVRGGRQFAERIIPAPIAPEGTVKFRDDGVFIITGGLGGLGLKCAEWVRAKGGKKIILLSRRTLPEKNLRTNISREHPDFALFQTLDLLEENGAEIETYAIDVRDGAALNELFQRLDERKIPVRGILHAAGVNWFGKVMTISSGEFLDTLKTKVSASWELHRHSLGRDLDCFVLFSSVSALWGSVELSHYSAANQFLDALSLYRNSLGLPATSVDWGPWAEVGMSAKTSEREVLEKLGFFLMPPSKALTAMEAAMRAGRTLSLIADVDWKRFQSFIDFCPQPGLFASVSSADQETKALREFGVTENLRSQPPDKARGMIEDIVRMHLKSVTLIESSDTIDTDQRFNFMGMDSLMAISFAVSLESHFQIKLPNTLTYNYPTIRAVTDHLFEILYPADGESSELEKVSTEDFAPEIETATKATRKIRLVALNDTAAAPNKFAKKLFCFPYAGSGVSIFGQMARALGSEVELIGLQLPGREEQSDVEAFRRMNELIEEAIAVFPDIDGEFYIFGHSLGAIVAYEFVLALQHGGRKLPTALFVSGCDAPLEAAHSRLHQLEENDFVKAVIERYESIQTASEREKSLLENQELLRADLELLETYRPKMETVRVPVTAVCGRRDALTDIKKMKDWVRLCEEDFSFRFIDGGHRLVTEHRAELSNILKEEMRVLSPQER